MKLYLININDLSDEEKAKCFSLMSEQRKKYIESVTSIKRKNESIAGEWLAKKAAAEELNLPLDQILLERTEKGKPFIKNANFHISISHSGNFAAVVTHSSPVGLDIEELRRVDLRVVQRVCSESDKKLLDKKDFDLSFLKIWTAKEAYFKMLGTGIINPQSVSYNDINATHQLKGKLLITIVKN